MVAKTRLGSEELLAALSRGLKHRLPVLNAQARPVPRQGVRRQAPRLKTCINRARALIRSLFSFLVKIDHPLAFIFVDVN